MDRKLFVETVEFPWNHEGAFAEPIGLPVEVPQRKERFLILDTDHGLTFLLHR